MADATRCRSTSDFGRRSPGVFDKPAWPFQWTMSCSTSAPSRLSGSTAATWCIGRGGPCSIHRHEDIADL